MFPKIVVAWVAVKSTVLMPTLYPRHTQTDSYEINTFWCITEKGFYLIRLLVVGVTDAVGEDESDSCGEVVPIAMRDAGDAPSGALISRLISSLLLRDTIQQKTSIY